MGKPFIKLLHTINAGYFYDVNRNQIVDISEESYQYLENLLADQAVGEEPEEITCLRKAGYLSDHRVKKIEHQDSFYLAPLLERRVYSITLQLTQQCNFRCSYCVYNDVEDNIGQRKHSSKVMSGVVAKDAIIFLRDHSVDCSEVNIGFYGGEPLLCFDQLKELTLYAENIFKGKKCTFSITTNGSLLKGTVLDFLVEHQFGINISIDGPKEIHDANRVFQGSKLGTYETVYRNLMSIRERYPDYLENIYIHMVMDPKNDYDVIDRFINDEDLTKIKVTTALLDDHYSLEKHPMTVDFQGKYQYQFFLSLLTDLHRLGREYPSKIAMDALSNIKKKNDSMTGNTHLPDVASPSGQCIPGEQRLFCDVEGNLYPCERVSETATCMRIGNIYDGFDIKQAYSLLNIATITEEDCIQCPAFQQCSLCISACESQGRISQQTRRNHCNDVVRQMDQSLRCFVLPKEYKNTYKRRE